MPTVRSLAAHRFPVLPDHPGETDVYRRRFQNITALLLAYRCFGTLASVVAFAGIQETVTDLGPVLVVSAAGYALLAGVIAFATAETSFEIGLWPLAGTRVPVGRGRRAWLDRPSSFYADLGAALAANLATAALLYRGTAYAQYTDLFAIANITTVALWTGRRGGRAGLGAFAAVALVEILKAPVNGMPLNEVEVSVVLTRLMWIAAGYVVAVGVVHVMLEFAEQAEQARLDRELIQAANRTHDSYKGAMREILSTLDNEAPEVAISKSRGIASNALTFLDDIASQQVSDTVASIAAYAVSQGTAANPDMIFNLVDAARVPVHMNHAESTRRIIVNLCLNAAQHSKGTHTTVHWRLDPSEDLLEVIVRDDGIGINRHSTENQKGLGTALIRTQMDAIGGSASLVKCNPGTKWLLRFPQRAWTADRSR